MVVKEEEADDRSSESPQLAPKLAFGLSKKKTSSSASSSTLPPSKKPKLENVFSMEEDEVELKPKRKLVPIDYSSEGEEKDSERPSREEREGVKGEPASLVASASLGERKLSTEEKKKVVQTLVNTIPTSKDEVFAYELKWEAIDKVAKLLVWEAFDKVAKLLVWEAIDKVLVWFTSSAYTCLKPNSL